jgi:hypothetical protein
MRWFELCENPAGVTTYYSAPPSLDDVVLRELSLMDSAPSVHFWFELPAAPDQRWSNWDNEHEVATMVLGCWAAKEIRFQGWGQGSRGSFRLERLQPKLLRFSFESSWFCCYGECEHAIIEDLRASRRR